MRNISTSVWVFPEALRDQDDNPGLPSDRHDRFAFALKRMIFATPPVDDA
jgi:hypothetical protein